MGLFEWLRVPFGLKGAPGYFQQIMATVVLFGILYKCTEVYLDDVFVHGNTEDEYFDNLEEVFMRIRKFKLTIHPEKMRCGLTELEYVGHTITESHTTDSGSIRYYRLLRQRHKEASSASVNTSTTMSSTTRIYFDLFVT